MGRKRGTAYQAITGFISYQKEEERTQSPQRERSQFILILEQLFEASF